MSSSLTFSVKLTTSWLAIFFEVFQATTNNYGLRFFQYIKMGSGIGAPDTLLHSVTRSELYTGLIAKPEPGPSPTFIF